jgi:hypothetical protein
MLVDEGGAIVLQPQPQGDLRLSVASQPGRRIPKPITKGASIAITFVLGTQVKVGKKTIKTLSW